MSHVQSLQLGKAPKFFSNNKGLDVVLGLLIGGCPLCFLHVWICLFQVDGC